jgi:16S rRNA (guanine527-N7)-methyltransferase
MNRSPTLDRDGFAAALAELGLSADSAELDQFDRFEENLYAANEVMNLTRVPREECRLRHFIDSLLIQDLIPQGATLLDIGSGPGFPAWPLACARRDLQVFAIDGSGKAIGFLHENPLPNLRALKVRAEDWVPENGFDFVTGRALAPLGVQLEVSAHLCKVGGLVVPMRTPNDREEAKTDVSKIGLELLEIHERRLGDTDVVRLFPVCRKVRSVQRRTWAEMKRKPLLN